MFLHSRTRINWKPEREKYKNPYAVQDQEGNDKPNESKEIINDVIFFVLQRSSMARDS